MTIINNLDQAIIFFIQSLGFPILDRLMIIITTLGDAGFIWLVFAIILIFNKKTRNVGYMVILALALNTLVVEGVIKLLINRPRPYVDFPEVKILVEALKSSSFPSGHTASSFAAAYILSKHFKKYALYFFGIASLIAFSRVYLFLHYPTDVIAGAVVGILCGMSVYYLFKKYVNNNKRGSE